MALAHTLELTSGPAVVPQLGYTVPITSTVSAMRSSQPISVQVASGGVAAALPTGALLYFGIKLPSAIKGAWLANCQLTASTDPGSPGLWTGTLQLNTPEMVTAMHGDALDPVAEVLNLLCLAEYYYTVPGQTDPVCALNFNFSVNAPLYNATNSLAPTANVPYPPSDQVDTIGARDSAIAAALAALEADPAGMIVNSINARISGKTAGAATMAAYSAADDAAHAYTRNEALWCADLNPTSVSASTSSGWRITMITPRHGVTAHHVGVGVGTIGYWVDKNNVTYTRTVTAVYPSVGGQTNPALANYSDLDLVQLDSDLPAGIEPSPVLPSIFLSRPGILGGVPVITHDQNRHFCIATLASLFEVTTPATMVCDALSMPPAGPYASWNRDNDTPGNTAGSPAITGDSTSPYFLCLGNQLALLGCFWDTTGHGPDPGANFAAINAIINPLGYSLTTANASGFPAGGGGNANTVNLSIVNLSSYLVTFAGIDCAAGATTNLGLIDPSALPILTHGHTPWATEQFYNGGTSGSVISTAGTGSGFGGIGDGIFACPYNYPAGCPDAGLVIKDGSGVL